MAFADVSGALETFSTCFLRRQCVYTLFAEIILAISNLSVLFVCLFVSLPFCCGFSSLWSLPPFNISWVSLMAQMVKNPPANARDLGSIPGSERSPGEGNDYTLQYCCLENPMDRGAWWVTVHGVIKSWTRLSD